MINSYVVAKTVGQLLQLPLTEDEETSLIQYLNDSKEPHSQEMLVLHYLQRARYVEAIHLNEKLKHGILVSVRLLVFSGLYVLLFPPPIKLITTI